MQALRDDDTNVRRAAATALKGIGGAGAAKALLAAIDDRDAEVREAVWALVENGNEKAVEPLLAALGDPNAPVRQVAVQALRTIGGERAAEALRAAPEHADPSCARMRSAASKR
ncbi:MAG: HEAT repeat domain-containing protein [Chloroflexi bacterium]|nr:HEAT repeat domain-containing protein [Chloroflexota bacterium]